MLTGSPRPRRRREIELRRCALRRDADGAVRRTRRAARRRAASPGRAGTRPVALGARAADRVARRADRRCGSSRSRSDVGLRRRVRGRRSLYASICALTLPRSATRSPRSGRRRRDACRPSPAGPSAACRRRPPCRRRRWPASALSRASAGIAMSRLSRCWSQLPQPNTSNRGPSRRIRDFIPSFYYGSIFPIKRGNGIVSRTWCSPQIHCTVRSTPSPKPACGTEP